MPGSRLRPLQTRILRTLSGIEPPWTLTGGGALASKLATLLERSEIRDLADVKALLDAGGDLEGGLRDAPKKDAGFSPLTLAWVLKDYDPRPALSALRMSPAEAEQLLAFRLWLIERLARAGAPK